MRDRMNEVYAPLREQVMRRTSEQRRRAEEVAIPPRPPRKLRYAPILAYVGVILSRLGAKLQQRYAQPTNVEIVMPEVMRD
ncbi:MAG: hypothetical protein UZ13_01643 [Chloroflexi bacterium OLB13]|nr:MAG: hypothetical protein UZ13_01643 [Chloroflexi bacterium OLB13]